MEVTILGNRISPVSLSDVTTYLTSIKEELSNYGDKMAVRTQLGHMPTVQKRIKFMLLEAFVDIAEDYLDEWNDYENNMFTLAEFDDIQQHINRIAKSFHYIDVSEIEVSGIVLASSPLLSSGSWLASGTI